MISMSSLDPLYQLMQPGTPTKASSFPGDTTMNHPYYLTPGTSTEIILNHSSASANMTDSCASDTMNTCDPSRHSVSPRTLAATADLHENCLPPRTRNQTQACIILCLPAQQTRAKRPKTRKSQPIPTNRPPQNLERLKELTRDENRCMQMDKARTDTTRYLDQ